MDINHLENFVTVAECGSINKAAKILYISQPHLSNIIRDLEIDIGFELFDRTNRGVALTAAGKHFLKHSKNIINEIESLREFTPINSKSTDKLRVSMTKFSHTMESFNEVCSKKENINEFTFILNEGTTKDVITDVSNGYTDVGVIHYDINEEKNIHALLEKKGLTCLKISKFRPEICVSKHHELILKGEKITLNSLKDYGFVRYLGQYEDFIYNISNSGHHMDLNNSNKIIYVYGRSTLMQIISSSNFYTIGIIEFDNQDSMYQVLSVPVEECENSIQFGVITRKNAILDETTLEFIENVTKRYRRLEEQKEECLMV